MRAEMLGRVYVLPLFVVLCVDMRRGGCMGGGKGADIFAR